jgi:Uma2 family endonuclease
MIAQPSSPILTAEAYLVFEEQSDIKHEYINGQAYAMAGTTDSHNLITGNLFLVLRNHLRGRDCQVYFADVKARIEARNCYYYPDLMVTCDARDRETKTYKNFPKLIIEILSDSTEAFDRGDKFTDYQTLDSLEEYALISTKRRRLETLRRAESGLWILQGYQADETGQGEFELRSLGLTGAIADLYEDVDLP